MGELGVYMQGPLVWWMRARAGFLLIPHHPPLPPVHTQGWRVVVDEGEGRRGWVLLRQSLHDPLLVRGGQGKEEGRGRGGAR